MSDSNGIDVATGASDLGQTFNESVGEPGASQGLNTSVGATAQAEIETFQEAEQALAQHDDQWRQLSDRLSARPQATPSMDIDGGSQRSIAREYTEHRRQWDAQRDTIEIGAIGEVVDIRANGTTLTKAFPATTDQERPAQTVEPPEPAQQHAAMHDASDRFQRQFSASTPEVSRSNDR